MSTMQQQAPSAEAIEEQMGKIVTELGAALGVLLTSSGPGAVCGPRWPEPGR